MGSKHNKKRFLIVNYSFNAKGGYDELVELSKKKCGQGKIMKSGVVLDLINKEVLATCASGGVSQVPSPCPMTVVPSSKKDCPISTSVAHSANLNFVFWNAATGLLNIFRVHHHK